MLDKRIYLLTAIAFVVGMVELLIGGILDLVALDLEVSVGRAGLLITVFALVFSISGPVLLFLTGREERTRVMLVALLVFIIGNLVAILGTTYSALMLSRIITAASGALLTVLSLALAAHISAPEYRGRAIGMVVMGISGSLVFGLPVGVSMGHAFGWRSPFILVTILALGLVVAVPAFVGRVPANPPVPLKRQMHALRDKKVLFGHLTTFFFLAGHFTLYGYMTPFLKFTMNFNSSHVALAYFLYGVAAVSGGGFAGWSTDKFGPRRTLLASIILLCVCLLIIPYTTGVPPLFWMVLVIWGVLSWSISPPIQSHLVQLAPETAAIQQSLNIAVLHLGIAFGTFAGSLIIDRFSVEQQALAGAFLIATSLGTALASLHRERVSA
ncbi:MFS transporter [Chelativorans sp. Marseille-P2723]|uniref:MFS transporter n=1 Tax=Chelativorans sp. Marseille-P2723 TaxID=2709133 RepID=UPI001AEDDFAE|nr:MFS transporter [Chelativorans sp. Marseille-P2723]